jgi:DnaK suppressor protein
MKAKSKTKAPAKSAKAPAKKKAAPKAPAKPAKPAAKKAPTRPAKVEKAAKAPKPAPARPAKPAPAPAPARTSKAAEPRASKTPVSRAAAVAQRRKEWAGFRELLLRKQRDQMQQYAVSKGDSEESLDNGTEDYIDYAVNSYAREFLLSLTEMDRKQLVMIEEALRRIDRGEYGSCQQCGAVIPRKRLEVQPWARYCITCQELEEQGKLPQYAYHPGEEEDFDEDEESAEPEAEAAADEAEEFEAEVDEDEEVETTPDEEPLVVDEGDGDDASEE